MKRGNFNGVKSPTRCQFFFQGRDVPELRAEKPLVVESSASPDTTSPIIVENVKW